MRNGIEQVLLSLFVTFTTFVFFVLFSVPAYADGGAPNLAYVAGGAQGVSVIDIGQQKMTTTFNVGGDPANVQLSLDGRLLYVAQPTLQQVTIFASKVKQAVCHAHVDGSPTLLALDSGQGLLYVAGNGSTRVTALNSTNCSVVRTLSLQSAVYGLALTNVSSAANTATRLWVAESNALSVFDTRGNPLFRVPFPQGPRFLCIPPGNTVYVATEQGSVVAVDTTTYRVSSPLVIGKSFGPMDYDGTTGEVYVPDIQQGTINVLAPVNVTVPRQPHNPLRTFHLGTTPQSIAITSDGQLGMIALSNGSIAMLDVQTRQFIKTIPVGGHPRFIITGLYPPPFNLTQQQFSLLNVAIDALHYLLAGAIAFVALVAVLRYRRLTKNAD